MAESIWGGLSEAGVVELEVDFSSSYPVGIERGDVFLRNSSFINVLGSGAGFISINARDLKLSGLSRIAAGVNTSVGSVGSNGEAPGVEINTKSLFVTDHAKVFTTTSGKGDVGEVVIEASDKVSIDGKGSRVGSIVTATGFGDAGGVEINAKSLNVTNGAKLDNETFGNGGLGGIEIEATDKVIFETGGAIISIQEIKGAESNSGTVKITAKSLEITSGSIINASTKGKGDAGDVVIQATDSIKFDGDIYNAAIISGTTSGSEGNAGKINITTGALKINGTSINANTKGKGKGVILTLMPHL